VPNTYGGYLTANTLASSSGVFGTLVVVGAGETLPIDPINVKNPWSAK
jgi:hypothetical protein